MTPGLFHGTDARLPVGAVLLPPAELNPADPQAAKAHPAADGTEGNEGDEHTFATEWPVDARGWGRHVYLVAPDGPMVPDWNGGEGDWAVRGRLVVLAVHQLPAAVEARMAAAS